MTSAISDNGDVKSHMAVLWLAVYDNILNIPQTETKIKSLKSWGSGYELRTGEITSVLVEYVIGFK